jgi:GH24 family phage-related lysozyme (muramidase)
MTPAGLAQLQRDEGFRAFPYDDATGRPVAAQGNVTVGYGRNLAAEPFTEAEALAWMQARLATRWADLCAYEPALASLPPVWADVVLNVDYNVGDIILCKPISTRAHESLGDSPQHMVGNGSRIGVFPTCCANTNPTSYSAKP